MITKITEEHIVKLSDKYSSLIYLLGQTKMDERSADAVLMRRIFNRHLEEHYNDFLIEMDCKNGEIDGEYDLSTLKDVLRDIKKAKFKSEYLCLEAKEALFYENSYEMMVAFSCLYNMARNCSMCVSVSAELDALNAIEHETHSAEYYEERYEALKQHAELYSNKG